MKTMTVTDEVGDYFYMISVKDDQGQMIFTVRKYRNADGELVSSESIYENRFEREIV